VSDLECEDVDKLKTIKVEQMTRNFVDSLQQRGQALHSKQETSPVRPDSFNFRSDEELEEFLSGLDPQGGDPPGHERLTPEFSYGRNRLGMFRYFDLGATIDIPVLFRPHPTAQNFLQQFDRPDMQRGQSMDARPHGRVANAAFGESDVDEPNSMEPSYG
jgi:hypothetical protein